ncbi:MAG: GatB/YqeY domain-containing protein [Terriglobia bacterium]
MISAEDVRVNSTDKKVPGDLPVEADQATAASNTLHASPEILPPVPRIRLCDIVAWKFGREMFMSIVERVEKDLVAALKAQEALKLSVLRMMKAALMNKKVELGKAVDDGEALAVLRTLAKQRRESVEAFRNGGRDDLADKEEAEIKIVDAYLPAAASEDEIDAAVAAAIAETGASTAKDMGKAMKAAMAKLAGKNADGKRVSEKVRAKLGA